MIDILTVLSDGMELVGSGVGVWMATEVVKKVPFIPVNEGQTTVIRSVAALLSVVAVVLLGFVNHDLQPTDIQHVLTALLGVGVAWATAHGTHKVVA